MYRTAMQELETWKNQSHKPLLILGARQTGKSWLMDEFGRHNYKDVIHLQLEKTPEYQSMFESVTDPQRIFNLIEIQSGRKIEPESTLVILDEIQEVPSALSSLKYMQEKMPDYHVMAAGSYLGTSLHRQSSFPVGKVDVMQLKPMSFSEFLIANKQERLASLLMDGNTKDAQVFDLRLQDMLKYYYFVGGMPEAVNTFVNTHDLAAVRQVQENLLMSYRQDFSKHVPDSEIPKVYQVWDSVVQQLAKENRKFVYKDMKKGARSKDYEVPIKWLTDTGLLHQIFRIDKPGIPLSAYQDRKAFKLYFVDIGLLDAMAKLQPETILDGSIFFTEFKGAMSEQFVLQELLAQTSGIYYWSSSDSKGEVDFITSEGNQILPIEVKSGTNMQSKSLKSFVEKYELKEGIRFSLLPYKKQDWLVNYPLYFAGQLLHLLKPVRNSFIVKVPEDIY